MAGESAEADRWRDARRRLHAALVAACDEGLPVDTVEATDREALRKKLGDLARRHARDLQGDDRELVIDEVIADAVGLGPLDGLLADDTVSDILITAFDRVFIEREGRLLSSDVRFRDPEHLGHVVQRLVRKVGKRLDERSPMVDARLEDGSRVNVIIPPLALGGPQVSIRRFAPVPFTLERLVDVGTMHAATAKLLAAGVAGRLNIVVSGGAGSGKTTLLNALSEHVDSDERIITIEDAAELRLKGEHVVRLETRAANLEGVGEVGARALVRNALRMRPDRILVGECRGEEAFDMLQAMNTGHEGSMTTLHANSSSDAFIRLESMLAMSGFDAPLRTLREYLGSAIDLVVQLQRVPGGRRVVSEVSEVLLDADREVHVRPIHRFRMTDVVDGRARGAFEVTGHVPGFLDRLANRGISLGHDDFDARRLAEAG